MDHSEKFDAVVIGSGLGGLTAGALYARAGNRVLLLERNAVFGGAATTYRYGDMTVEGSLHETADPRKTLDPKGPVFEALDLYDVLEFAPAPDFYEVRSATLTAPFVLPHGFDDVEAALISRFPDQESNIKRFLRQIRRSLMALEYLRGPHDALWRLAHVSELPLDLWAVIRDFRSSLSEVLERYFGEDEAIKIALAANLPYYADDPDKLWWLTYAVAQGSYLNGGGVYIKGGSQRLCDRLVDIIREGNGVAISRCSVERLELNDDGAVARVCYNAAESGGQAIAETPVVFANAAPHAIADLLPETMRRDFMTPYVDKPLSISLFSATFGLDRPPCELGITHYSTALIPDWMRALTDYRKSAALFEAAPGELMPAMVVVDYDQLDSGLTGDGLYPVSVVSPDRLANWEELDVETYRARKKAWGEAFRNRLDREWPGFAACVSETTISTARAMKDHLNTPGGAVYGFAMAPPRRGPISPPMQVETSIDGLWLASAFGGAGGFSGAMGCGAAAAKAALKAEIS